MKTVEIKKTEETMKTEVPAAEVKTETITIPKTEEKKQKDSFPYAMKSLKILIEKTERNKWLEEEEVNKLKEVHKKLVERYIGLKAF